MIRFAWLVLCLTLPSIVVARDYVAGTLQVGHPWALPSPPGAPSVAGYLSITNDGEEDDRLLGGTAAFAGRVELHETRIDGDVARMRELPDGILVPAGTTVTLEPNGAHLMLIDSEPLASGERYPVTLEFEQQGPIDVELSIERPDNRSDVPTMDHGAMDHDDKDHDEMDHDAMDHDDMDHDDMDHDDMDHDDMDHSTN